MEYCVVETFEGGQKCFSSCPLIWIIGKFVMWPPNKKNIVKARKAYEVPDVNWKKIATVNVFRKNFRKSIF